MVKLCLTVATLAVLGLLVEAQHPQELVTATNYRTDDGQQRSESRDGDGNVRGEYSYVDPNGRTIKVRYTAGKDGFKVEGDHLPVAPQVPASHQAQPQQPQPYHQPQPQYQPQQYQPQQYQQQQQPRQGQYNPVPAQQQLLNFPGLQQPNNALFNPNPQYQPQQYQQPQYNSQPSHFNNQQQAPAQPQYNPFQYHNPQQGQGQGQVSVSQTPNAGFSYTYNV